MGTQDKYIIVDLISLTTAAIGSREEDLKAQFYGKVKDGYITTNKDRKYGIYQQVGEVAITVETKTVEITGEPQ